MNWNTRHTWCMICTSCGRSNMEKKMVDHNCNRTQKDDRKRTTNNTTHGRLKLCLVHKRSQLQTWIDCPSFSCQQNTKDWGLVPFFLINHDKKRNAPRTPFPQHTLLVLHILTTVEAPVFGTVYLVVKWTNRNYKLLHTLSTICWSAIFFLDSRWRGQYGLSTVFCNEHRLSCSSLIGIQHTLFLHRQHLHFSFSISQWWF